MRACKRGCWCQEERVQDDFVHEFRLVRVEGLTKALALSAAQISQSHTSFAQIGMKQVAINLQEHENKTIHQ